MASFFVLELFATILFYFYLFVYNCVFVRVRVRVDVHAYTLKVRRLTGDPSSLAVTLLPFVQMR